MKKIIELLARPGLKFRKKNRKSQIHNNWKFSIACENDQAEK